MRHSLTDTMKSRLHNGLAQAKALGADAAKLTFEHYETTLCTFKAGRLKDTGGREALSYGIEVLVSGRRGSTSGNDPAKLDSMIEHAVSLARAGSVAHFEAYPAPGDVVPVKTHSETTLALTREQMIAACRQINDAVKAYNPDVWVHCIAARSESEELVVTSGGVCHATNHTLWELAGSVQRTEGADMFFANDGRSWRTLNDLYDPDVIAERVIRELRRAERTVDPPLGRVKAYLPPETFERLLWALSLGTNGRNVAKGDSPLAGRLGEQVLSPTLTLIDDPHQDYASSACAIDNNGIPTRKQTLFDKGVLQRFLYDLDSAGLAGTEPTGNDNCRPYRMTVLPGEQPSEALLAGIEDGLYIRGLLGFGQSNIMNGDFSCNVGLGYRIQNGEITGRVKNTMVAGNLYELFANPVQLSSDLDYRGCYPHAVIEGVNVSAGSG